MVGSFPGDNRSYKKSIGEISLSLIKWFRNSPGFHLGRMLLLVGLELNAAINIFYHKY